MKLFGIGCLIIPEYKIPSSDSVSIQYNRSKIKRILKIVYIIVLRKSAF